MRLCDTRFVGGGRIILHDTGMFYPASAALSEVCALLNANLIFLFITFDSREGKIYSLPFFCVCGLG